MIDTFYNFLVYLVIHINYVLNNVLRKHSSELYLICKKTEKFKDLT
ncbi:hypothetical protein HS7_12670 [Sulfolobales archaeon HS-7]|nr:hypothetical protein HS7_12670 [Sulfolobales archaeon HS-7]